MNIRPYDPELSDFPSRILVVEDDINVRDFCVRLLRMNGYNVAAAENGKVALNRLKHEQYDLVLTDLQMPEMNGIDLLQHIREEYPDLNTIVFTAYATVETARNALKLGAFDYLTKPVTVDELERIVRRALEWQHVQLEKQRLSQIVALYEISQTFTSTLDIATAVHEIVRVLWRRFSPQSLSLSLLHPEVNELELLAQRNQRFQDRPSIRVSVQGHDERDILRAHIDLAGDERSDIQPGHVACLMLRTSDRSVGVLQLVRGTDQPGFDADDQTLLKVCASQIAASIDNSRLYQQLKDQNLQTIAALAAAIDARDPYTAGHSEQVRRYAVRLGEVVGLPPQRIEHIHYGALLHDIGKIGIRDYVLLKPGPLTDAEFAIMQTHPTIGADILRNIKALRDVIPIIECHHERMDGRGYPQHLHGLHICEEARIVAIADAYDAMTSNRSYRRAMEPEQAFQILLNGRDVQWDGAFVEAFVALMRQEGTSLVVPEMCHSQIAATDQLGQLVMLPIEAGD